MLAFLLQFTLKTLQLRCDHTETKIYCVLQSGAEKQMACTYFYGTILTETFFTMQFLCEQFHRKMYMPLLCSSYQQKAADFGFGVNAPLF
ncbi:hypothetical protein HOLleu_41194 [Holothuria leucospilota]|uniref:Secreted protein n=1 Tax=Holothuria leucospilota TaxID=206669 RepID=A0A9Q0YD98_HOLLE|nr:hypothetical protein HOLleu_41194 [Holothuria leucospilota]